MHRRQYRIAEPLDDPARFARYHLAMRRLSERMIKGLAWRSRQPVLLRWVVATGLIAAALFLRNALGPLHGANPALVFYPVILLATTFLGWREAMFILLASAGAGSYFFLPASLYLQPFAWLAVGSLNILIIATLKRVAQELQNANDQQKVMFQELQHRVANTLQAAAGTIERARRQIDASPSQAAATLDEASRRVWAAADMHRRLNDPDLLQTALKSILWDAVASIIDPDKITLTFDINQPYLTLDQMSTITMIIIECAHNAQKHVFAAGHGSLFSVTLRTDQPGRGILIIADDGPGLTAASTHAASTQNGISLGQKLIQRLAAHLGATVSMMPGIGTEIVMTFPLEAHGDSQALVQERKADRAPRSVLT